MSQQFWPPYSVFSPYDSKLIMIKVTIKCPFTELANTWQDGTSLCVGGAYSLTIAHGAKKEQIMLAFDPTCPKP